MTEGRVNWWSQAGSNRRPPACKAGALPAELWPLFTCLFCDLRRCTIRSLGHVHKYTPSLAPACALLNTKNPAQSQPAAESTNQLKLLNEESKGNQSNKEKKFRAGQGASSRSLVVF